MIYRCLICNTELNSPEKLDEHLQFEHKWGVKKGNEFQ